MLRSPLNLEDHEAFTQYIHAQKGKETEFQGDGLSKESNSEKAKVTFEDFKFSYMYLVGTRMRQKVFKRNSLSE